MERWVEYYIDLYFIQNIVIVLVLDVIECLLIMDEFDVELILEELSKVIDNLVLGKVFGNDGIFLDLFKQCKSFLLLFLYKVLCECWEDGSVL